jgi:hypothetical protein
VLGNTGSYEGYNFSAGAVTGVMAAGAAAASEIFQFRWNPGAAARKARILCVQLSVAVDTTAFTAGAAAFDMTVARAWTAAGTGGGTVTPAANSNKLRTSQVPSLFSAGGEIRVATTAPLGAGTKTLDTTALNNLVGGAGAAGSTVIFPIPLYVDWAAYGIPLVLSDQEGFVIRASVPATGTWKAGVWVAWAEIDGN